MHCRYCVDKTTHPLFVYLISEGKTHTGSRIGIASHPMQRINPHNRVSGWLRLNVKSTKHAEGRWRLELIIGPFWRKGAAAFSRSWNMSARKLQRRIAIGIKLAEQEAHAPTVYARDWTYIHKQLRLLQASRSLGAGATR